MRQYIVFALVAIALAAIPLLAHSLDLSEPRPLTIPGAVEMGSPGAIRVQAAGVASTGTGTAVASAAPSLGLVGAYYQTATVKTYVKDSGVVGKWYDASGNGNHLYSTSEANSPSVDVASGIVFRLNTYDNLRTPTTLVRGTGAISFVIYHNLDNYDTGTRTYFKQWAGETLFYLKQWNYGRISAEDPTQLQSAHNIANHTGEYRVAYVLDGASSSIWLNGSKIASGNSGSANCNVWWYIGGYPSPNEICSGRWYGLLIYRRALSDAECSDSVNWFN